MPAILVSMLAWLKGAALVAKFGSLLGPIAALVPGGQIFGIVAAIAGGISKLVGWFWRGVEVIFTNPVTLVVVVATFLGGMWLGVDLARDRIRAANEATRAANDLAAATQRKLDAALTENAGWRKRYDEEQARAAAAEAARDEAVRKSLEASKPAQPSDARRVRAAASATPKPAAGKASDAGLFGLGSLQWPFK